MNRELVRTALRTPLLSLVAATTGVMALSATATGYARVTGSFVDDGFCIGQEVSPVGFPQTTPGVITAFTATTLTIDGGRTVASAAGARSLTAGLPSMRAWVPGFKERAKTPFVDDELTNGPRSRDSIGSGEEDDTGIYYVRPYCVSGVGDEAIDRYTRTLLDLYPIGHAQVLADGSVLRIRGYDIPRDIAPSANGSPLPYNTGWRVLPVSIPWRLTTPG